MEKEHYSHSTNRLCRKQYNTLQ